MNDFEWDNLRRYCELTRKIYIKTDDLVEMINKYGVNTLDKMESSIGDQTEFMTLEQIDLIFDRYGFNIFINNEYMFFDVEMHRNVYLVQKCLEYDHNYRYLLPFIRDPYHSRNQTLKQQMEEEFKMVSKIYLSDYSMFHDEIRILIDNHEKRGTSFFQLMFHRLNIKNNSFNKK